MNRERHDGAVVGQAQRIPVADDGEDRQTQPAHSDPDGEPTRQHGRPHGAQGALREVARRPQREGGEGHERKTGEEILRRTDRA